MCISWRGLIAGIIVLNESSAVRYCCHGAMPAYRLHATYTCIAILLSERLMIGRLSNMEILTPQSAIRLHTTIATVYFYVSISCTHITLGCTTDVSLMAARRYAPIDGRFRSFPFIRRYQRSRQMIAYSRLVVVTITLSCLVLEIMASNLWKK